MPKQPLNPNIVSQYRAKLRALRELQSQQIATAERDATIISLQGELRDFLMTYAEDMLGSWMSAHFEFAPLVAAFIPVLAHAQMMIRAQQAQQQPSPPPANVVQLGN